MTNTKFRKRALLSSVAMLLVALVALGSATFAWFVANPTVTAKGLKMQTVAAPGLLIDSQSEYVKKGEYSFANKADLLPEDVALLPASPVLPATWSDANLTFAQIKAQGEDNGAADTEKDTLKAANVFNVNAWDATDGFTYSASGNVYKEDIFFKKSADSGSDVNIKTITVNIDSSTNAIASGVKVALVATVAGASTPSYKLLGIWKADNGTNTSTAAAQSGIDFTAAVASNYIGNGTALTLTSGNYLPVKNAGDPSATDTKITAYVYLDGQESTVKSTNANTVKELLANNGTSTYGITVTFTTAE